MNLVRHQLHFLYKDPSRPWDELRSILRVASADSGAQMQAAPMVIERAKEKTIVVVQVRAVNLIKESSGISVREAAAEVRSEILRLHEVSPFPRLQLMQYEAILIEPFDLPFHELVDQMKNQFLTSTRIANQSTDLGLVFDQRDEYVLKRVNIGPMDRTQLETEVLKWPRKDLPQTFVFASIKYEDSEERDFSEDLLEDFISRASEWQSAEAELLAKELVGSER